MLWCPHAAAIKRELMLTAPTHNLALSRFRVRTPSGHPAEALTRLETQPIGFSDEFMVVAEKAKAKRS